MRCLANARDASLPLLERVVANVLKSHVVFHVGAQIDGSCFNCGVNASEYLSDAGRGGSQARLAQTLRFPCACPFSSAVERKRHAVLRQIDRGGRKIIHRSEPCFALKDCFVERLPGKLPPQLYTQNGGRKTRSKRKCARCRRCIRIQHSVVVMFLPGLNNQQTARIYGFLLYRLRSPEAGKCHSLSIVIVGVNRIGKLSSSRSAV